MPPPRASAGFHLVCSDEPRNGKTLYARLLADYLILCERVPLIFDASGGADSLSGYFPVRSDRIDLSGAPGQMALFDRVLDRQAQDCVIDLPAHVLAHTAKVMRDIGFAGAARGHGLSVIVHFLLDRRFESLFAARNLRSDIDPDRFIMVRNEAVVPAVLEPAAHRRYDELAREGQVTVPALDAKLMTVIEADTFSFSDFARDPGRTAYFTREDIKAFLGQLYSQFDMLALASDFADRRQARKLREPQA